MRRSLPTVPSPSQPQQILNYTIASDIQFSSSSNFNGGHNAPTMNGGSSTNCSPFLLHPAAQQQQQHQYLSYPLFEGPFQIIEPGSDAYIEMVDSDFGLDPNFDDGSRVMEQQELFISENGIPQEVLEDVFRLDDEIEAAATSGSGGTFPKQYPVASGLSMGEYEKELVAEMEKLFPEVAPVPAPVLKSGSRLMEELVRTDLPENPYYMSVQLKGDGARKGRKMDTATRDAQRGLRCVEMIDGNGIAFKANYYHHQRVENRFTPVPPVPKSALQHRRVKELLQSPPLRNLSPAMASKIESLASGNRNVTLTPVRTCPTPPPPAPPAGPPSRGSPKTTTIVIKTPKRTIASNATPAEPIPPPPLAVDFPFPIAMIKQEPPDEPDQSAIPRELTPIDVPVIVPTPVTNKQPRKQKLQSLSQCDVVFKETTTASVVPYLPVAPGPGNGNRKLVQRPRGPPPNDFVTVTIKDVNNNNKNAREQSPSTRPTTPRASTPSSIKPSANQARPPTSTYPFKKRSLVTHYRVQMIPNQKRIHGQPVESIEILDSSDEEDKSKGSSSETAPQSETEPQSEPEEMSIPKLPGNTESIQCPFCCKVFFTSHSLMLHGQNCADAVLFGSSSSKKPPSSNNKRSSRKGESLLKSSAERNTPKPVAAESASRPKKESKPQQQPASVATAEPNRKRMPHPRSSMRLSIEILPSAFSIDNLLLCDVCKKTFRSQEHLEVHQKIHKTPTICNYCKRKFYETPRKHICQEMKRSKQQK